MISNWYLGVDAGASKTSVMIQTSNNTIYKSIGPSANFHNLKLLDSIHIIQQTIQNTLKQVKTDLPLQAECACIGWSGLDTKSDRQVVSNWVKTNKIAPSEKSIIVNDAYIALRSIKRIKSGICIISGTGSQCYGISRDGNEAKAGHWGYLLGDQGSGFVLGQAIVQQVMKEIDNRSKPSIISKKVLKHFKLADPEELASFIYNSKDPVKTIASTTTILEDKSITNIPFIDHAANFTTMSLLESIKAVYTSLLFNKYKQIPLGLVGGLFNNHKLILNPLKEAINKNFPRLHPIRPQNPPVYGALLTAINFKKPSSLPLTSIIC